MIRNSHSRGVDPGQSFALTFQPASMLNVSSYFQLMENHDEYVEYGARSHGARNH